MNIILYTYIYYYISHTLSSWNSHVKLDMNFKEQIKKENIINYYKNKSKIKKLLVNIIKKYIIIKLNKYFIILQEEHVTHY
jgi:hypothetical protein